MGKEYSSEELASRTFLITMLGVGAFIVVVFVFILL
jgi:hypothetical protein